MLKYDLVVVGGGPAGMAAALSAKDNGIDKIIILERAQSLGGILEQCIHTGFGLHYFKEELSGPEYAAKFVDEIKNTNIDVKTDTMVINITKDNIVTAVNNTDGLIDISATAIILAMGCRERPAGALGIAGPRVSGIMTAGTAQKYVNIDGYMPGKKAVILGSGDIGLIMARRMVLEGADVKMVCELMPYSGGLTRNIVQCLDDFNIPLKLSCTVVKVHGRERLEGVTIAYVDENRVPIPETEEYVECDTLLLSVGLIPENELSRELEIEMDPVTSGPVVNEMRETSHRGIFACGNVLQVHDLVDYVTVESQIAGKGAAQFILNKAENITPEYVLSKSGKGIRYIVPQRIDKNSDEDIKLYFRVDSIYENSSIVVTCKGIQLSKRKHPKLIPGEIESVIIKHKTLNELNENDEIIILVEE